MHIVENRALLILILNLSCVAARTFSQSKSIRSGAGIRPADLEELLSKHQVSSLEDFLVRPDFMVEYKDSVLRMLGASDSESQRFDWLLEDMRNFKSKNSDSQFSNAVWTLRTTVPFYNLDLRSKKPPTSELTLADAVVRLSQNLKLFSKIPQTNVIELWNSYKTSFDIAGSDDRKKRAIFQQLRADTRIRDAALHMVNLSLSEASSICLSKCTITQESLLDEVKQLALRKIKIEDEHFSNYLSGLLASVLEEKSFVQLAQYLNNPCDVHVEVLPINRPIHSIWKGIQCHECVGGKFKDSLTPARWASGVLGGARHYAVYLRKSNETESRYVGFVQLIPIRRKNQSGIAELYGSLDTGGSPELTQEFTLLDGREYATEPLIVHILRKLVADLPEYWKGLVKSDGDATNSNGVAKPLFRTETFKKGRSIGSPGDFEVNDSVLGQQFLDYTESKGGIFAKTYGYTMIVDRTITGAFT
jgi:hypothetical protein